MTSLTLCELPALALLHLRGRNIGEFLQGQLTCDLRRLSAEQALRGAMCNVKGRVLSDLWVLSAEEDLCLLRLRTSIADAFADNLRRYAQFSRISVERDQRPITGFGITGTVEQLGNHFSSDVGSCRPLTRAIAVRTSATTAQVITLHEASSDTSTILEAELGLQSEAGDASAWHEAELRDGHYALESGDEERFTPQALNYDLTDRVAFDKGCYTGQEVVARLHYKGESKKRLGIYETSGEAPAVGDEISDAAGERLGEVLRVLPTQEGGGLIAAMVSSGRVGHAIELPGGTELAPVNPPLTP